MKTFLAGLLCLACTLLFLGSSFAQEFRSLSITHPSNQLTEEEKRPPDRKDASVPAQAPLPLAEEKSSEFERYLKGKVEITESQFKILQQYPEISFSHKLEPLPVGMAAVSVRIVKPAGAGRPSAEQLDAGFLVGRPALFEEVFNLLEIESTFNIPTDVNQFGYDFFMDASAAFVPAQSIPVGPDYVIGPDDEVRVTVWGKVEGQWNVVVGRDGSISLPKVGVVGVAGLTFEQLKDLLRMEFGKYYTGFEMSVSMGALRTMTVYVVGNARRPGSYTLSSLSTIFNALVAAGGPSKTGTMRDVQLKRGGHTIAHLDLYELFRDGDKSEDMRLMSEDVIFIPTVGPLAAVTGSVLRPAIYEIREDVSVLGLIEMAGGFSDIAFRSRIQVERIADNARQIIFESSAAEAGDIMAQAGDVVKVFPYVKDRKVVRVSGAVHREGEYGFREGMTLKDLLTLAGGLKYFAFREEAELTRVSVTGQGQVTERLIVNIERALADEAGSNILLMENDYFFVRAIPEWQLYQTVSMTGEVRFPGTYTIRKGEKLSSLIERAGGFTGDAYLKGSVFVREKVKALQQQRLDEMIDRLEMDLFGAAVSETLASTTSEEAKIEELGAEQKRRFVEKLKGIRAQGRMAVRIDRPEALRGTPNDIELKDGDSLNIPQNPSSVQVIGSVYNQTAFVFDADREYGDYIDLAGGYTENADKKRVYILKADGTAVRASGGDISWNRGSSRWQLGGRQPEPGDTVVVPEMLEKIAWLRETKDITQILYQIAVTAGILIVAF